MPIELFVPKYERAERAKRSDLFGTFSELGPKGALGTQSWFGYRSVTLADTIRSRSNTGDGVCRNLDTALFGSGAAPVNVYYSEVSDGRIVSLEVSRQDTKLNSNLNFRFARDNRLVSAEYNNEVGDGNFNWTWPSFATGVLELLAEDLRSGREFWADKLRDQAEDYYQKIGADNPDAVLEIRSLVERLKKQSTEGGDCELFVFAQPPIVVGDKLILELITTSSFLSDVMHQVVLAHNYDRKRVKYFPEDSIFGQEVCILNFDGVRILVAGFDRQSREFSRTGKDLVEYDFAMFMEGGEPGSFAIQRIGIDESGTDGFGKGILLTADSSLTYPIFGDE